MNNEFSQKSRQLFNMGGWCRSWETGRNDADCLHHILGRVSNSPYNAAPLNNMNDHQPEGRKNLKPIHSFEVRSNYLNKTKEYLEEMGHKKSEKDLEFIKKYKKYYEEISKQNSLREGGNPFIGIAK